MRFHLPKPLHGWREFAGEVGIIVLGVLIALAAQHVVDDWRDAQEAEKARDALRSEIGDDNLPQAYVRMAIAPCLKTDLQAMQKAFDSGVDRSRFAAMAKAFVAPERTWDRQAWDAVIATGTLAHGGAKDLIPWSYPYTAITLLATWNVREGDDLANLRSVSEMPGPFTSSEEDRVTTALQHLKHDQFVMVNLSKVLTSSSADVGITLSGPTKKQLLADSRSDWGPCAEAPAEENDIKGQLRQTLRTR